MLTLPVKKCLCVFTQSNKVENEGLVRVIEYLHQHGCAIGTLVTDRHCQIAKGVRENLLSTDHRYDIWHLAKCM